MSPTVLAHPHRVLAPRDSIPTLPMTPSRLPEDPGLPWERQPGESEAAWKAFTVYRDLPLAHASAAETARRLQDRGDYKSWGSAYGSMKRWMKQWSWVERRDMWQAEEDRRARETTVAARVDLRRRWAVESASASRVIADPIRRFLADLNTHRDAMDEWWAGLGFAERMRWAQQAAKILPLMFDLEARALGELPDVPMAAPASYETGSPIGEVERQKRVAAALEQAGALTLGGAA